MSAFSPDICEIARRRNVRCVLDVGANIGQFGRALRDDGFSGALISFEPIASVYAELSRAIEHDPSWSCHQAARGAIDGSADIHVSKNFVSSSLLRAKSWSIKAEDTIREIDVQTVRVRRLDTIWPELSIPNDGAAIMLKIDVQGTELQVIEGLGSRIAEIDLFLLETSLLPVYDGEPSIEDVIVQLRAKGLHPVWIGQGWSSGSTRQVFQCDIVFSRDAVL